MERQEPASATDLVSNVEPPVLNTSASNQVSMMPQSLDQEVIQEQQAIELSMQA